jgi:hypothetical protein
MTVADPVEPETAVRRYLRYLEDPDAMRDEGAIAEAEEAVSRAEDPIERLRALAALDRARSVDGETYRQDFVRHAKAWAEAEGIPARAFLELGVPAEDLAAAGIAGGRSSTGSRGRGRAPRLDIDAVEAAVPADRFRLAELAAAIDREVATTRRYLQQLLERGSVRELGDDPDHDGRGRAPKLYEKAT